MPCWAKGTALVASAAVCRIVISSVTFFLLFCPASRGAPKGEWGLLARPRGAFCGGAKKLLCRFVSWGTANPEGGEAEAEPRRAASAQGWSPARRAREKRRRKGEVSKLRPHGKRRNARAEVEKRGALVPPPQLERRERRQAGVQVASRRGGIGLGPGEERGARPVQREGSTKLNWFSPYPYAGRDEPELGRAKLKYRSGPNRVVKPTLFWAPPMKGTASRGQAPPLLL